MQVEKEPSRWISRQEGEKREKKEWIEKEVKKKQKTKKKCL